MLSMLALRQADADEVHGLAGHVRFARLILDLGEKCLGLGVRGRKNRAVGRSAGLPWRYLIDARAPNRLEVRGRGLDSEWSADIRLRGTTAAPTILGQADMIRGGYEFAGKRFELTRGRIRFFGQSPPDPLLDILAEADVDNLSARIAIRSPRHAMTPKQTSTAVAPISPSSSAMTA